MAISSPSPSSLPFNIIKGGSGRAGSLQNTGKTQSEICWIAGVDARSPWDHAWIAPGSLAREGLTRRTTWAPSRKELKKLLSFLSSETAHKADELYKIWQKLEYLPMASLPHLKNAAKRSPRTNPQEITFYAKGKARGSYFPIVTHTDSMRTRVGPWTRKCRS